MQSPARDRALRLLVGLLLGAALVFLIAADTAQATSCSGSIGQVTKQTRRGTITTIVLQFSCDTSALGFQVRFGGAPVDDFVPSATDSNGVQYVFDCSTGTNEFDCSSDSPVPPGTTISGTPSAGEFMEAVCSVPVTVTVDGPSGTVPYSFQPTSSCPAVTKQAVALNVKLSGDGSGTVEGGDISCPGSCSETYRVGQVATLAATAAKGSTFAGWSGGGCRGTGTCRVTLNADTTVTATFTKAGGTALPPSKLHASVDSPAKVSGTSVTFTLGCHAPTGRSCGVLAILTTTQHLRSGKVIAVSSAARTSPPSTKVITVARRVLTIAAGAHKTVTLSLNTAGKSLLARFHKLPARLTVSVTNTTKPLVVVSKTVTFKPPKKPAGRSR